MLQAAAYVICAYLTGMRDSELQAMRVGCWSLGRSADGIVERHRIKSITYKARETSGEEAEWVTIAPVVRAIEVVERLTLPQREIRSADTIWQTLTMHNGKMTVLRGGVIGLINGLRDHLDARSPEGPAIPQVEGRPWWFTPRQFRRTLAWYIANRPFGTVAGKIQYKHASIAMFEGYSGSSPSGFRREVEQERALGQIDDVVEHYEEAIRRGLPPAGPAATRLRSEFARIRDELGDPHRRCTAAAIDARPSRTDTPRRSAGRLFLRSRYGALPRPREHDGSKRAGTVPLPPGSLSERLRHAPSPGALAGVDRRGRTPAPGSAALIAPAPGSDRGQ